VTTAQSKDFGRTARRQFLATQLGIALRGDL
jgi:hypothetical protein